jgi:hypothetical protein
MHLLRSEGPKTEFELLAEANDSLPTLWIVLLGEPSLTSKTLHYEEVLGQSSRSLCTSATEALARYRALADFIVRDPRSAKIRGLMPYLAATDEYMTHQVMRVAADDTASPLLCVNLDQLAWMGDSRPDVFMKECIDEFRQGWSSIQNAISVDAFDDLSRVLAFDDCDTAFDDWVAWSTAFGFSSLRDPYFCEAITEPSAAHFVGNVSGILGGPARAKPQLEYADRRGPPG